MENKTENKTADKSKLRFNLPIVLAMLALVGVVFGVFVLSTDDDNVSTEYKIVGYNTDIYHTVNIKEAKVRRFDMLIYYAYDEMQSLTNHFYIETYDLSLIKPDNADYYYGYSINYSGIDDSWLDSLSHSKMLIDSTGIDTAQFQQVLQSLYHDGTFDLNYISVLFRKDTCIIFNSSNTNQATGWMTWDYYHDLIPYVSHIHGDYGGSVGDNNLEYDATFLEAKYLDGYERFLDTVFHDYGIQSNTTSPATIPMDIRLIYKTDDPIKGGEINIDLNSSLFKYYISGGIDALHEKVYEKLSTIRNAGNVEISISKMKDYKKRMVKTKFQYKNHFLYSITFNNKDIIYILDDIKMSVEKEGVEGFKAEYVYIPKENQIYHYSNNLGKRLLVNPRQNDILKKLHTLVPDIRTLCRRKFE